MSTNTAPKSVPNTLEIISRKGRPLTAVRTVRAGDGVTYQDAGSVDLSLALKGRAGLASADSPMKAKGRVDDHVSFSVREVIGSKAVATAIDEYLGLVGGEAVVTATPTKRQSGGKKAQGKAQAADAAAA